MRIAVFAAAACLSVVGLSAANDVEAAIKRFTSIPAQPLTSALQVLAKAHGFQIVYRSDIVNDIRTSGAVGEFTTDEALTRLLSGTALAFKYLDDKTITIIPRPSVGLPSASNRQAQVTVGKVGRASREAAAGSDAPASGKHEDGNQSFWNRFRLAQADQVKSSGDESADTSDIEPEEVVVTGSRIRNREAVASPLTTFSQEDIQETARTDVSDFLQTIPQNFSGGSFGLTPDGVLGGGSQRFLNTTGAVSPNLRGLGPGSTLTLVNGHRVATAAGSAFVDVGAIPLSAIERVDVIADGASAVYGGEAVGGVVNFILRKELDGAETNLSYELAGEGDYSNLTASQSFGTDWNTGEILLSGTYRDRGELKAAERSFSRKLGIYDFGGVVLDPQLYPDQKEYSALAVVRQEFSADVEGSIDAWYSRRDQRQVAGGATQFTLFDPRAQQFSVNASLDANLFAGLRANLHGGYSASREDVSQEDFRPGIGRTFFSAGAQDFDLWYANVNVDGNIVRLPGGEVSFAVGAEHREEDFTFDLTSAVGPVFRQGSREVSSAYGELLVPIVGEANASSFLNRVSLSFAGRYDRYSDVGDARTGKAGLVVDVLSGLRLRGTYSSAFRAPTVDDFTRSGITDILAENILFLSPTRPGRANVIGLRGRADLKPERANILTAGLEVRPSALPDFFASVTYFDYDYKERLAAVPLVADLLLRPDVFGDLFRPVSSVAEIQGLIDAALASGGTVRFFNPSIPLSSYEFIVDLRFRNLAVQKVRGLDFELRYGFNAGGVRLDAQGAATYVLKDERKISPSSVSGDFVGFFAEQPKLKLRSQISARSGGFTATGAVTHLSSFENTNVAGRPRIKPFTTADLHLQYRFDRGLGGGTTTLGFAVRNVFDKAPPFVQRPANAPDYDPGNANPLGRVFMVRLNQNW